MLASRFKSRKKRFENCIVRPAFTRHSFSDGGFFYVNHSFCELPKVPAKPYSMHYVYILKCGDGAPYTGCTQDLKARFERHTKGQVPATKLRLPVSLAFYCAFVDKYKAFEFEKYLKSGSGRAFMKKRLL
jgi:putative endonuclease